MRLDVGAIVEFPFGGFDHWVQSEFKRALAVFSGVVDATDIVTATFKVEKVWKGKLASEVVLPTGAVLNPGRGTFSLSTCDWSFEKGKKYLIFAYGERPSEMRTSQCTPTSRLDTPSRAVEILNRLVGG